MRIAASFLAALLLACGEASEPKSLPVVADPLVTYSCAGGVAPPSKVITHANPLAGRYIVVLTTGQGDVATRARQLAAAYGGDATAVFQTVPGFALTATDAQAAALAADASVCFVEQDQLATGT